MDVLRSCYSTRVKWSADSDETSVIDWYFVDWDTPVLGFPTAFCSRNWTKGKRPDFPVGEVNGAPRPWRNGRPPSARYRGTAPCGDPQWFRFGVPLPLEGKTPQRDLNGYPVCCDAVAGGLFLTGSWLVDVMDNTIQVMRSDGLPFLTEISTLMLDQASGFGVDQPMPHIARITLPGGGGMAVGAAVSGADPGSVLFVDTLGQLAQGGGGNTVVDPDGSVGFFGIPGAMYIGDVANSFYLGLLGIWDSDTGQWTAWYTQAGRMNLFGPGLTVGDLVATTTTFESAALGGGAAGTPTLQVAPPASGSDDQMEWAAPGGFPMMRVSHAGFLLVPKRDPLDIDPEIANAEFGFAGFGYFTSVSLSFDPYAIFVLRDDGGTFQEIHLGGPSAVPTVAAGTGAGTSPTLFVNGTNASGIIQLTTGTGCAAAATILGVSFDRAISGFNGVTFSPGNAAAAAQAANVWLLAPGSSSSFELHAIAALPDSTDFVWYWSSRMQ